MNSEFCIYLFINYYFLNMKKIINYPQQEKTTLKGNTTVNLRSNIYGETKADKDEFFSPFSAKFSCQICYSIVHIFHTVH